MSLPQRRMLLRVKPLSFPTTCILPIGNFGIVKEKMESSGTWIITKYCKLKRTKDGSCMTKKIWWSGRQEHQHCPSCSWGFSNKQPWGKGDTQNTVPIFCLLKTDSEYISPVPPYSRNTKQNSKRMQRHRILQSVKLGWITAFINWSFPCSL